MDKATNSYESQAPAIESTQKEIAKAYEYDKHRLKNTTTIKMWQKLLDTNGHLWGGFIRDWKAKGNFRSKFIEFKKEQISEGYDQLIELEQGKRTSEN